MQFIPTGVDNHLSHGSISEEGSQDLPSHPLRQARARPEARVHPASLSSSRHLFSPHPLILTSFCLLVVGPSLIAFSVVSALLSSLSLHLHLSLRLEGTSKPRFQPLAMASGGLRGLVARPGGLRPDDVVQGSSHQNPMLLSS